MTAERAGERAGDDLIPLSALQHFCFCPRQCALIHIEREWAENALTTLGTIEHERVDNAPGTTRGGIRTARGIELLSRQLGIRGRADAVEYHTDHGALTRIIPVEYKHGAPKEHRADEVQLCAQALCLEEMHGAEIPCGALYYHATRHRCEIAFTRELRQLTLDTIAATRALFRSGALPPAQRTPACRACSLFDICLPSSQSAARYNDRQFNLAPDTP